jgi:ribosomal protein S18 acetylase RimI-like enzyme
MGYALGRLEEIVTPGSTFDFLKYDQPPSYIGHLASLALHERFRGQGVAQALMQRLHSNLAEYYDMDKVNLFCRVRLLRIVHLIRKITDVANFLIAANCAQTSNQAALKLYGSRLDYQRDRTVCRYYLDGEDAHLMLCAGLRARWRALSEQERQAVRAANALPPAPIGRLITALSVPAESSTKPTHTVDMEQRTERLPGGSGKDSGGGKLLQ